MLMTSTYVKKDIGTESFLEESFVVKKNRLYSKEQLLSRQKYLQEELAKVEEMISEAEKLGL